MCTNPYTAHPFNEETVSDAIAGLRPYLKPADRQEAIRRLAPHHKSTVIADRLGISRRTVDRAKRRLV